MKRVLACTALAACLAVGVPGAASAWHGGGWHGGGGGWHGGWGGGWHRGWGWGGPRFYGGFYPAYYGAYGGCWRWVRWPYWHRIWACY
jgi:hypothetical protein